MTRRAVVASLALLLVGCATLQQIAALSRVAFGLGKVLNGRIAGVPLSRFTNYRDLTVVDMRNEKRPTLRLAEPDAGETEVETRVSGP